MKNKFSIYLTGFRKNHGTQHALFKSIETSKTKLNMGHNVDVIYVDLSRGVIRGVTKGAKATVQILAKCCVFIAAVSNKNVTLKRVRN